MAEIKETTMEDLVLALRQANSLPEPPDNDEREATKEEDVISAMANELFITHDGRPNFAQIHEFERFAPCVIWKVEGDSFGWLIGGINYNGRKYYFG